MTPIGYFSMQVYGKIIFIFQHRFNPNHLFLNYLSNPRNLTYGSLLVTKLICPGVGGEQMMHKILPFLQLDLQHTMIY